MHNYKIIDVLKSFNRKEFKKLGEFTSSPYYNKNKHVSRLINILDKYYPEFNHKKLAFEEIFTKLFPGDKYDYHKIKILFLTCINYLKDIFLHWGLSRTRFQGVYIYCAKCIYVKRESFMSKNMRTH